MSFGRTLNRKFKSKLALSLAVADLPDDTASISSSISSHGDVLSVRKYPSRSRSFIRKAPAGDWSRSSAVIARLRTLGDSPRDVDIGVEVLKGYIDAKRRKGRGDGELIKRLEAIRAVVPATLHDAFLFARHQCALPLPSSFTGCIHRYARSRTIKRESIMGATTPVRRREMDEPYSGIFSPRSGDTPDRVLPSFVISSPDVVRSPLPQTSQERAGGVGGFKKLSLGLGGGDMSFGLEGFDEFCSAEPPSVAEEARRENGTDMGAGEARLRALFEVADEDEWDLTTLDHFPLPPRHLPVTPRRMIRSVSASSTPSIDSAGSSSSDEMPITPGSSEESAWGWSEHGAESEVGVDDDDDSRTITDETVRGEVGAWASRMEMSLGGGDVFSAGLGPTRVGRRGRTNRQIGKGEEADVFGRAM